jgi:hypothetical protein
MAASIDSRQNEIGNTTQFTTCCCYRSVYERSIGDNYSIEWSLIGTGGSSFGKKSHTLNMRRLGEEVSRLDEIELIIALLAQDL